MPVRPKFSNLSIMIFFCSSVKQESRCINHTHIILSMNLFISLSLKPKSPAGYLFLTFFKDFFGGARLNILDSLSLLFCFNLLTISSETFPQVTKSSTLLIIPNVVSLLGTKETVFLLFSPSICIVFSILSLTFTSPLILTTASIIKPLYFLLPAILLWFLFQKLLPYLPISPPSLPLSFPESLVAFLLCL